MAGWIVESWADKHEYIGHDLDPTKFNVEHVLRSREVGKQLRALNPITPNEVDRICNDLYTQQGFSITSTPACTECNLYDGGPRIILNQNITPWFSEMFDSYAICPSCSNKIQSNLA